MRRVWRRRGTRKKSPGQSARLGRGWREKRKAREGYPSNYGRAVGIGIGERARARVVAGSSSRVGDVFFFIIIAVGSLRQQRSDGFQAGVARLVQWDVQDLAEVDRVGGPELIGTTQLGDSDPVFQSDASERIVRRDLSTWTTLSDKSHPTEETWSSYLVNKDGPMSLHLVGLGNGTGELRSAWSKRARQARSGAVHVLSRGLCGTT